MHKSHIVTRAVLNTRMHAHSKGRSFDWAELSMSRTHRLTYDSSSWDRLVYKVCDGEFMRSLFNWVFYGFQKTQHEQ